jgi:ribosomal protein S18 acetylase RimI-like enzyme
MEFIVQRISDGDHPWVLDVVRHWGADFIITRGRRVYPQELDGFIAVSDAGEKVGLLTYEIIRDQCEIVTLDAFRKFQGVGTALVDAVRDIAADCGCQRLWLITTNDNLDAIRFYQRRGFTIAAVHVNALAESRKLKPAIPMTGEHGIPLRDEIEFEMVLDE